MTSTPVQEGKLLQVTIKALNIRIQLFVKKLKDEKEMMQ